MQNFGEFRNVVFCIAALVSASFAPARAYASQEFPGAIQEAAGMPCAPSCALCHGVTPGTGDTYMKKALGKTLFSINSPPPVIPHDTVGLKAAYAKYAMDPANAAAVAALKEGIDPETGTGLCGPTYGCGAHVAKQAPPNDGSAPIWVIGAMVVGGLLRRKKL